MFDAKGGRSKHVLYMYLKGIELWCLSSPSARVKLVILLI